MKQAALLLIWGRCPWIPGRYAGKWIKMDQNVFHQDVIKLALQNRRQVPK